MSKFLNTQTNDFDSWFDSVNLNMEFWESPVYATRFGYEAGQQSRQAEIDNLKKRIDDAVASLEYNEYVDSPLQALEVLKGDTND
mgnify:CR=1 FL=1